LICFSILCLIFEKRSIYFLILIFFFTFTVPPSFISSLTSSDTERFEGDSVSLRCAAKGFPIPEIQWRREDKEAINAQSSGFTNKNKKGKKRQKCIRHFLTAFVLFLPIYFVRHDS